MAARYSTEFTSLTGVEYKVEILDNEYSDEPADFSLGMDSLDGFSLTWDGGENRYQPIIGSSVTINMLIQITDALFTNDLAAQPDNRFFIQISRKDSGTYKMIWVGEIAADLVSYEDESYPYVLQLQAYDTISILKNTPFPGTLGNSSHFVSRLFVLMGKTRILDKLPNPSIVLRTAIQWYEKQMFDASPATTLDPLSQSKVYDDAFMYFDETLGNQSIDCYSVLEQIALRFGAQFFFAEGAFHFIHYNRPGTSLNFRNYNNAMSKTTGTQTMTLSLPYRSGGAFRFLPAAGTAIVKYPHSVSVNTNNLLPVQSLYEAPISVGNIQGGSEERLMFTGNVGITMNAASSEPTDFEHRWVFKLRIQVGSNYLSNETGTTLWTTDSSKRYLVKSQVFYIIRPYARSIPVSILTPPIPTSGAGTFEFDFIGFDNSDGDSVTIPYAYTATYYITGFNLRLRITEGSLDAGELTFKEYNTSESVSRYNSTIELPDVLTGDGPQLYSKGRMLVYADATASWEVSEEGWQIDGAGEEFNINELMLKELISGQENPRRMFEGTVFADRISPANYLVIDSVYYTIQRATFNAMQGQTSGLFIRNYVNRGISSGEIVIGDDPYATDGRFDSLLAAADTYLNAVETTDEVNGGGLFESESESQINSLENKEALADPDVFMIDDSADSYKKKKFSFSNMLSQLTTYFNERYLYEKASGTQVNAGTNDGVFVTAKSIGDSDIAFMSDLPEVPEKATEEEINEGSDEDKYVTPYALANSNVAFLDDLPTIPDVEWVATEYGVKLETDADNVGIGTDADAATKIKVISANNYGFAIYNNTTSTNGFAVLGYSQNRGVGGYFYAENDQAIYGYSNAAETELLERSTTANNTVETILKLKRTTTSGAVDGFGGRILFETQLPDTSYAEAGFIQAKLTNSGTDLILEFGTVSVRFYIDADGNLVMGSGASIKIPSGDLVFTDSADGIILKSPGGTSYRVTIDNSGNLIRTAI